MLILLLSLVDTSLLLTCCLAILSAVILGACYLKPILANFNKDLIKQDFNNKSAANTLISSNSSINTGDPELNINNYSNYGLPILLDGPQFNTTTLNSLLNNLTSYYSSTSSGKSKSKSKQSQKQYNSNLINPNDPIVYICMTSLPSRIHHIDKSLQSIKQQSYSNIAKILLTIPEESRRENNKYSIPDRLSKDSMVEIIRIPIDFGPATRLFSALQYLQRNPGEFDPNEILLITMDDDLIYHPDAVQCLVRHSLIFPDCALGFAGYSFHGAPYIQENFDFIKRIDERAYNQLQFAQSIGSSSGEIENSSLYKSNSENNHRNSTSRKDSNSRASGSACQANNTLISNGNHNHSSMCTCRTHLDFHANHLNHNYLPDLSYYLMRDSYSVMNNNEIFPTESVDVLQSWRISLYRPRFFPALNSFVKPYIKHIHSPAINEWLDSISNSVENSSLSIANFSNSTKNIEKVLGADLPSSLLNCDDEFISAVLNLNGVSRRVVLAASEIVFSRLKLKHGRSASPLLIARQSTLVENLIQRDYFYPLTLTLAHSHSHIITTANSNNHGSNQENGICSPTSSTGGNADNNHNNHSN
jgi:hypothetical protein